MIKLLFRLKWSMLPVLLFMFTSLAFAALSSDGSTKGIATQRLSKINSDYLILDYNNMVMPLDNKGVIADVNDRGGRYQEKIFLFSGGFFISGKIDTGLFGSGVMSASRINDYVTGPVGSTSTDSKNKMYLVTAQDPAFGTAWQDWSNAVSIGADFYDGDHDGVYSPVDKNGNGVWDIDEDRPDLIGDFTAWCVYNDGLAKASRRFTDVDPKGIEIRQSVFGFQSKGIIGNMLFVRYRIVNMGTVADRMDSVYFSVACDPDLGDYTDDLIGCDTVLSCGFTYNGGADKIFGTNPPCFMVDFFQGPVSYIEGETYIDKNNNHKFDEGIDSSLSKAYNVRGKVLGIDSVYGAKNLPLTSFTQYMQSHPSHGDPNTQYELRNYIVGGRGKTGVLVDPCTWAFGTQNLANCASIDPKFMYSGDPVSGIGWINNTPQDQRQMSNSGPFELEKNKPIDIVVAYIIGQGNTGINSIAVTKINDDKSQKIFNANFPSPPPPNPVQPKITTGDGFIDLDFATDKQVKYRAVDTVLQIDRRFQGFYITAYATQSKAASIEGVENAKIIATYDLKDSINNIYQLQPNGGMVLKIPEGPEENKLDSALFADPTTGRIKFRLTTDPFTNNGPLVKGKEYFFTITTYTLNQVFIYNRNSPSGRKINDGRKGDYCDSSSSGVDEFDSKMVRAVYGTDMYLPSNVGADGILAAGASQGNVKFLVVDNEKLIDNEYSVEFFKDSVGTADSLYTAYWRLKNLTTGKTYIDSTQVYSWDTANYSGKVYDGFFPKVKKVVPLLGTGRYVSASNSANWFDPMASASGTGFYYLGADIGGTPLPPSYISTGLNYKASKNTTADRLRQIEIRFGTPGKAYRYVQGFLGNAITRAVSAYYAGGISAADTVGKGPLGMVQQGYVDVPFTVWVKDTRFNIEKQLAAGFVERSTVNAGKPTGGNPDGIWNPLDSVLLTHEYILVFDADYDPLGKQIEYTGGTFNLSDGSTQTVWAELKEGMKIPDLATGVTVKQRVVANSTWFNALYIFGIQRKDANSTFGAGDKYVIPVGKYPYTEADKYTFKPLTKGVPTMDSQKDLFNKVNVFPNPLFAYNPTTSYTQGAYPDDPFVTFSNLPYEVTVKIYTLSGTLIRTLTQNDKADGTTSPFLKWNLKNESGLRCASGMYLAIVSSPKFGEKILKFGVIMPQKQIRNY